ncbi:MAG: hypothetical protein M1827_007530 [Pycnora praestabilis]|nr:MAG: hypothetical protein M1827_007530 [Pycnora praestabilis]
MDPITAAGLGLGIAQLTMQVFAGCLTCYEFVSDIQDMPADCQYLRIRLEIEHHRLLDWSTVAGLLDGKGDSFEDELQAKLKLDRSLLLAVLTEIQATLMKFAKMHGKYEELRPTEETYGAKATTNGHTPKTLPYMNAQRSAPQVKDASSSEKRLVQDRYRSVKKRVMGAVEVAPRLPRRLQWVAIDAQKFEALLKRLTELNGFMEGLMDDHKQEALHHAQHETHLEVLQLNTRMEDLTQLIKAMTIGAVIESARVITTNGLNRSNTSLREKEHEKQSLLSLAKFKEYQTQIEAEPSQKSDAVETTKLDRRLIKIISNPAEMSDRRAEALYDGKTVWIEWKEYETSYGPEPSPDPVIVHRVKQLAALLGNTDKPKEFRAPHCLGYFDDNGNGQDQEDMSRFGFVFEKPNDVPQTTEPRSLLELFSKPKPSLTKRIALAQSIANSILYLHSVNWLHKGLRSHNIVFFYDENGNNEPDYVNPYLSGFDYARPARSEEMTEKPPENAEYDVYRHPSTHGDGPRTDYKKSYDIYSLGVILIELVHWKRIDKIIGIPDLSKARPPAINRIRKQLLEENYLPDIEAGVGIIYEKVVRTCLGGAEAFGLGKKADETDSYVGAVLQRAFLNMVVDQLEKIKV